MTVSTEAFTVDEERLEDAVELITTLQHARVLPKPGHILASPDAITAPMRADLDAARLTDTLSFWPWLPDLDQSTLTLADVAGLVAACQRADILVGPGLVRLVSVVDLDQNTSGTPYWRVGIELPDGGPMLVSRSRLHLSDFTDEDLDVTTPADLVVTVMQFVSVCLDDLWADTVTPLGTTDRAIEAGADVSDANLVGADAGLTFAVDLPRLCRIMHARAVPAPPGALTSWGLAAADLEGWVPFGQADTDRLTARQIAGTYARARETGVLHGPDVVTFTLPEDPDEPGSGPDVIATVLGPFGVVRGCLSELSARRHAEFVVGGAHLVRDVDLAVGLVADLATQLASLLAVVQSA